MSSFSTMKPSALFFAVASLLPLSLAFSPHDAAVIRDAHARRDFLESRLASGEDLSTLEKRATGVTGSAYGFATGTTGGGSATPAYPSSRAQLVQWLEDSVARVILFVLPSLSLVTLSRRRLTASYIAFPPASTPSRTFWVPRARPPQMAADLLPTRVVPLART